MIKISDIIRRFKNYLIRKISTLDLREKPFYTKDILAKSNYVVGEFTYGKPIIFDWGEGSKLSIGKFCSIADDVKIFLGGNHQTNWVSTYPFNVFSDKFPKAAGITGNPYSNGNVVIGNDVWIGKGAAIMSGVTIGHGAVIGAYSIVAKNVGPYEIHTGNPAKCVRKRFDDMIIEQLLEVAWWDWPIEEIASKADKLSNNDIINFIQIVKKNDSYM